MMEAPEPIISTDSNHIISLLKNEFDERIASKNGIKLLGDMKTIEESHCFVLPASAYKKPSIRRAKLMLFGNMLMTCEKFRLLRRKDQLKLVKNIERECCNKAVETSKNKNIPNSWSVHAFRDLYHSICAKISANLEVGGLVGNNSFSDKIISGEIDIKDIPRMSAPAMFPKRYEEINKKIEMSKKAQITTNNSTAYTCKRCKGNDITSFSITNRSADEGTSYRHVCKCGYSFFT